MSKATDPPAHTWSVTPGDTPGVVRLAGEIDFSVTPKVRERLMAYKILKNAGYLPPELLEEREIVTAAELLAAATDEQERYRQMRKLDFLVMDRRGGFRRP